MAYSNEELTQRIKQLEAIILDLQYGFGPHSTPHTRRICVNRSLHSTHYGLEMDAREHPADLHVPHYTWEPQIDWGKDMIHLHPGNKPR